MKALVPFLSLLLLCWAEDDAKITAASNDIGLRLFPLLPSSSGENVFFSPYSLYIAMGMAYAGARAETQQELHDKLGYANAGLSKEQVLPAFASQTHKHQSAQSNTTVDVANSAALHLRLPLLTEYENALRDGFNAELQRVDFEEGGQAAIDVINGWVNEKTHNKIQSLFSQPLSQLTRFVLLNAIYFKGKWDTEFDKRLTSKRPFLNGGVTEAEVDTMFARMHIRHNNFPSLGVDVAELPYRGGDYSMVILLPTQNTGVEALKRNLTADQLKTLLDPLEERQIDVYLPKFKLETTYSLKDPLKKLGITRIFGDGADLSGITAGENLKVSDVVQKAVVEVDEEGTVAAVVTAAVGGVRYSAIIRPEFRVDHPFLFFIRNRHTNAILFGGQVNHL